MKDMSDEKGEQFSLQWNNFHTNLSSGFHAFLQGQNLVDVTLAAGGKFIQAHKLVLSVCSSYFKDLFEVNPCKHPIVIMKDVGHKELEAILEFMYRGETNVCQDDLTEFLKTAEMLQVKGLADSESSEEHMPIPSKTVTTSLASQSVSDKPLPQAPKRERPVKALPQEVAPQSFKRVKHEPSSESPGASTHPPVSLPVVPDPIPQRLVNSSSKSEPQRTKEIEHVELTQPKMELVEIEDSDPEEVDNGDDFSFFGGESSQSFQDTSGAGSLPDFDNLSQYANMLQEDGQGFVRYVWNSEGKHLLVYEDFIYNMHCTLGEKQYWKCVDHYMLKCRARVIVDGKRLKSNCAVHTHRPHSEGKRRELLENVVHERTQQVSVTPKCVIFPQDYAKNLEKL
ncbi:protein bric-a-brac 1-like isoform X7 [Bacillus rossius redtenbacheri]|uniref:protein bric-a-brac 1-like isoform X7 n=1 Tax=Bacillus rossius redtenbacheri TaxID=93214 RepID=UPI002FDDC145